MRLGYMYMKGRHSKSCCDECMFDGLGQSLQHLYELAAGVYKEVPFYVDFQKRAPQSRGLMMNRVEIKVNNDI